MNEHTTTNETINDKTTAIEVTAEDTSTTTTKDAITDEVMDALIEETKEKKGQSKSSIFSMFDVLVLIIYGLSFIATILFFANNLQIPCIISFILQSFSILCLLIHLASSNSGSKDEWMEIEEETKIFESHKAEIDKLHQEITNRDIQIEQLETNFITLESQAKTLKLTVSELTDKVEQNKDPYQSDKYLTLLPRITDYDEKHPTIDIIKLVNEVMAEFEEEAKKAGIVLQLSTASSSITVKAAPSRVRVLFRNIIDNSIKYMQQSGLLVITISNIGSDIFIVLKDNGLGLSKQETDHVFELNFQGSNRISGNGLGLAQSKAIVEYYGGTIYAKSSKNLGMAIYIQLPTT